jgi:adenylate cyclase
LSGERVERRLAAILAADVVGYSRLVSADEADALMRLGTLRRVIIEPNIANHSGRLFKIMGDGFLVEFASAVQAVSCALAIQTETEAAASGFDDAQKMRLRIGIHVGDVMVEGEDLMGDGINIAARLESIAAPGGVSISRAVHDQVRDRIKIAFDDQGEVALKNIARPVQVFAVAGAKGAVPVSATPSALALPDKPSIAVLPFQNMSGDPEQEYFADGLAEDIITELSRFREFAVIARNSTFFYKGKPLSVPQVARELQVRYVLEGSVRKIGSRVRVTAQLIDAMSNDHIWAERYDREIADVFALQEEITRMVVASIAPQINLAEMARSRREPTNLHARQLALRAAGLYLEAHKSGNAALMQEAATACQQAIAADASSLPAHFTLFGAHWNSYLCRWGDPDRELERAWAVAERMMEINPQDELSLTARGWSRVTRGEYRGALADLRRAHEVNPNYMFAVIALAFAEATMGLAEEAQEHAQLALRLSPRDYLIGTAHLALAMAHFTQRNYDEATRWCESAIQAMHRAPIRRALMIACSARAGDMGRAHSELAVLNSFAPGFIASLFRGQNPVFVRKEDMENLLGGLRLAGVSE